MLTLIPNLTKKEISIYNTKNITKYINTNIKAIKANYQEKHLLTINIPKIKLSKKVYNITSQLNNVEKNIEIISSSNIDKNYIILASHSGTNKNAYFNNLHLLEINDLIYIQYNNKKYTYKINKIYYIEKTGYLEIPTYLEDTLILITCSLEHKNKQLIISSEIINIKNN